MGIGSRFFFIDEEDKIIRVPAAKFERLHRQHPDECMPQFKNKRMRYVYASLNVQNKKPISIFRIDYSYVAFDSDGRLDENYEADLELDSMNLLAYALDGDSPEVIENVINAEKRFLKKRIKNRISWEPSKALENKIIRAIFA